MANEIKLEYDLRRLNRLKRAQAKHILKMYEDIYKDIQKKVNSMPDNLQKAQLLDLKKEILARYRDLNKQLELSIINNMTYISTKFIEGFADAFYLGGIQGLFAGVPQRVVNSITSGKVYANHWTLSDAIWGEYKVIEKELGAIIAQGVANNAPTIQIAEALERYVQPGAKKPWEWSKVYPQSNKIIDYNAQRLARTLVQHAYQQAFEVSIKDNPFITKVKWVSALAHGRTCELCRSRHNKLFDKDNVPLDHPNGLCTLVAVTDKPLTDIADDLADWAAGKGDKKTRKSINRWANKLMRQSENNSLKMAMLREKVADNLDSKNTKSSPK